MKKIGGMSQENVWKIWSTFTRNLGNKRKIWKKLHENLGTIRRKCEIYKKKRKKLNTNLYKYDKI